MAAAAAIAGHLVDVRDFITENGRSDAACFAASEVESG
jgi:hypothetical protein